MARHLRTIATRPRRARWLLGGAGVLVALVAGVVATAGDGDERPGPEVLGVSTEREPTTTSTAAPPSTTSSPSTTRIDPSVDRDAPSTAPPPTNPSLASPPTSVAPALPTRTPTTTTTVVCRNASDPACGPLSWTPTPADRAPVVRPEPVPPTVVVGQVQVFAVEVDDPDGGTSVPDCVTWTTSDPDVPGISSCGPVAGGCPRFGPHDPPPAVPRQTRIEHEVTFSSEGEQWVTVSGSTPDRLDDGCSNPYTTSWTHTFTVTVEPAADDEGSEPPGDDEIRLG